MVHKNAPKLSVIVPVYGVSCEEVSRCVESICRQDYQNIEIILVDDGAGEVLAAHCDDFTRKDNRIRVIHKENGGVSSARNAALLEATGAYVTFVDSDDWISPETFADALLYAERIKADVVLQGATIEKGARQRSIPNAQLGPFVMSGIEAKQNLMKRTLGGWGVAGRLYRSDSLKGIFFDTSYTMAEDLDFQWRVLSSSTTVAYYPSVGYHYCLRQGSATQSISPEKRITGVNVFRKLYQNEKNPELRQLVEMRYCKEMASCLLSMYRSKSQDYEIQRKEYKAMLKKHIYSLLRTPYCSIKIKIATLLLAFLPDISFQVLFCWKE